MAAQSKACVCGRSLAGIAGSNPTEGMVVSCECYVLSGRGLCVGLIIRTEGPTECDGEASTFRRPWPPPGLSSHWGAGEFLF